MSRMRAVFASMIAILFAVAACQDQGAEVNEPLAPDAQSVSSAPAANVSATEDLPPHPESAVHDAADGAYLVSNLGKNTAADPQARPFAHLFDEDDNGFISRVELNPDGSVADLNKFWIADPSVADGDTELTADVDGITGVTIQGQSLYAVDRDEILVFDLNTDPVSFNQSIPLPPASVAVASGLDLPNDIVVESGGAIWLTDTSLNAAAVRQFNDAVYKWSSGTWMKMVGGAAGSSDFGCPNGVDLDASEDPLFLTFCSNEVKRIGSSGVVTATTVQPNPTSGAGVGRLDGLVHRADGSLLFSDWRVPQSGQGMIHRHGTGQGIAAAGLNLPADIGFDAVRERVLIPSDGDQQLKVVSLTR